ncbi:D-alanine--D-alanine ligase [Pleionea sediminis]|uniref:D-alanine--D-alanine ligase n=1 Tax=Pleionea sediminis TaxID=2569479 RepID=UPI0011849E6E|nr:D-alanine--D-alanine ligase [Pleionea sediminis]
MSSEYAEQFGKVAVLLGGNSAEREISLRSGEAVLKALLSEGINAFAFDPKENSISDLIQQKVDRAWNALHGRGGEDGQFQGVLETLNIPYTGSSVLGCALAMDKWRSKMIWKAMGLPVAAHVLVTSKDKMNDQFLRQVFGKLGPILFVKPSHEGSSVGMSKVDSIESLMDAIEHAREFDSEVLVESFIEGKEYTVSILNDEALPSISMETTRDFYDFEAKYNSKDTQYFCPSGLNEEEEVLIQSMALTAFNSLGCKGWGRVDFIRDNATQQFKLLEANTVPGMTESSLVPKAAKQKGISFNQLTVEILKTSL